jgi:hypothetical protein
MRSRAVARLIRVACVTTASAVLVLGPVGCDGGGANTSSNTPNQVAPEIKNANENMENFMKNQGAAKTK